MYKMLLVSLTLFIVNISTFSSATNFITTDADVTNCLIKEHPGNINCLILKSQILSHAHTSDELEWFVNMNTNLFLDIDDEQLADLLYNTDKVLKSYPNILDYDKNTCIKNANVIYNVYVKFNNSLTPDLTSELFKPSLIKWSTHACNTGKSQFDIDSIWDMD